MLTPPVRANARYNGAIGCLAVIAAGVMLFIAWYNLDLLATWFEAVGYVGTVLFIALGLLTGAVILIRHWLSTERDCDEIDERTAQLDGRYHMDGCEAVPGAVTHYDYQRGIVWQEWDDSTGYHARTIRRLTAAEIRENEILCNHGGYGKIDYRGDQ